jgi:hypothetical protein
MADPDERDGKGKQEREAGKETKKKSIANAGGVRR